MPTILIVDDDARCREPIAKMLRTDGYDVIRVANGKEAIDALEHQSVDLVLLDLLMPEMDGMTFLKTMRADERWSALPVIMVSGIYDGVTVGAARSFGVKDFLIKSRFSITELLEQVRWYAAIPDEIASVDGQVSFASR